MKIIEISKTDSTNSWLASHADATEAPCLVYALEQTAGRGQRGNSWESEPGMNLCASLLLQPDGVEAAAQFVISEAVALAVTDVLGQLGVEAKVKWPNDIYAGDRKICGILIENSLLGSRILKSVAGVGVNINQTRFVSDAPNPVSVAQITGRTHEIAAVARMLGDSVGRRMVQIQFPGETHRDFLGRLWRGDGALYPFLDKKTDERISASIQAVGADGTMTLLLDNGETRGYIFKEIEFLL